MTLRSVVVAHRETMVAEGIAAALDRSPWIVSTGVATTAQDVERWGPRADAVALDPELPGARTAAARLRAKGVRVVLLGGESSEDDDGVRVSTRASVEDLVSALVPGAGIRSGDGLLRSLTPRERDVLRLVARGMATKQVARYLGISPKTVELHKGHIYAKLGVSNQAAAVHRVMAARLARANAAGLARANAWTPSNT